MATDVLILDADASDVLILDADATDALILELYVIAVDVENNRPYRELVGVSSLFQRIEGIQNTYVVVQGTVIDYQRLPGGQSIYRPLEGVSGEYQRLPGAPLYVPLEGVAD